MMALLSGKNGLRPTSWWCRMPPATLSTAAMAYVYIPPSEEGLMQTINQQYHPLPMEQALGICWKSGSWMGEVRQIVENTWFLYISKKKRKRRKLNNMNFLFQSPTWCTLWIVIAVASMAHNALMFSSTKILPILCTNYIHDLKIQEQSLNFRRPQILRKWNLCLKLICQFKFNFLIVE